MPHLEWLFFFVAVAIITRQQRNGKYRRWVGAGIIIATLIFMRLTW